jgi:Fur family transcriptional regulator, ferric uptake regulator
VSAPHQAEGTTRRPSRQRSAVVALLKDLDDFRSAQDLHALLRRHGDSIGLATVYRALQSLVDSGRADVLRTAGGEAVYRDCSRTHHHHLVCRECGKTIEVQGPAVERWADQMAAKHGYADVSHTLELFGTCPACRGRQAG